MIKRALIALAMVCLFSVAFMGLALAAGNELRPAPQPGPTRLTRGWGIHAFGGNEMDPGPKPGPSGLIWGGGKRATFTPADLWQMWRNRIASS